MTRRCLQMFVVPVLAYLLAVALVSPVAASIATTQQADKQQLDDPVTHEEQRFLDQRDEQNKKKHPTLGCELLERKPETKKDNDRKAHGDSSEDETCVKMDVEAWYHSAAAISGTPPITGAPAFSPYAANTMHVGATSGREDSRTYVTLDLADLPLGATINDGTLVLALYEAETRAPESVKMEACSVIEPPENSQEGSFDTPPEHDCSTQSEAVFKKRPQPMFVVDLEPFAGSLTSGASGLVLLPTEKTSEEGSSWHVSLYGKKNESEDAVLIAAALKLETVDLTDPPSDPVADPPLDTDTDAGEDFGSSMGSSSAPDFSGSPGIGSIGLPEDPSDTEPVDLSTQAAAPVAIVVPRYSAIWYLPIVLIAGVALLGSVLTRTIEVKAR